MRANSSLGTPLGFREAVKDADETYHLDIKEDDPHDAEVVEKQAES